MAEMTHKVLIGRRSGPVTDLDVELLLTDSELETAKDILAAVNAATNNKEWWTIYFHDGRSSITPICKGTR